jgi:hypothetical protein
MRRRRDDRDRARNTRARTVEPRHRQVRPTAMNVIRTFAVVGCAAALLAGCADKPPTTGTTPSVWPSANPYTATYGPSPSGVIISCSSLVPDPTLTTRTDLPDDPLRADVLWYPGIRAGTSDEPGAPCRTWHTSIDKTIATALVADLKALPAPPVPSGASYSCGGNEAFIQVWFATLKGSPSFRIRLQCSFDFPSNPDHLGTWPTGMPRNHF